jgi:hypothetical protein
MRRGGGGGNWRGRRGGGGGGGGGGASNWSSVGDPRGCCGLLISCDEGREKRAMHEVLELLTDSLAEEAAAAPLAAGAAPAEGAEAGGGAAAAAPPPPPPAPAARALTVEEELALELAEVGGGLPAAGAGAAGAAASSSSSSTAVAPEVLQARLAAQPARFMELGTRGLGLIWVTRPGVDILAWVDGLFARSRGSGRAVTRYVSRLLPAQRIVTATPAAIGGAVRELIAAAFPPGASRETTYKVELRMRNSGKLDKREAMDAVTGAIGSRHLVMLEDPATVVLVEVCKHLACVAVLPGRRWQGTQRYNLRLAVETEEEARSRLAAAAANTAAAAAAAAAGKRRGGGEGAACAAGGAAGGSGEAAAAAAAAAAAEGPAAEGAAAAGPGSEGGGGGGGGEAAAEPDAKRPRVNED